EELIDRTRIALPAEMDAGDDRGPGVDVDRQEARAPDQGIDQRALPRLDLPDHGDSAGVTLAGLDQLVQGGDGLTVEHRPKLGCELESGRRDFCQLPAKSILSDRHVTLTIGAGIPRTLITR